MAAVLLSSVWGASGLDRLRPTNVHETFLMHALFSLYGAAHWPDGNLVLHAQPVVSGNSTAVSAAHWARNSYE